VHPIDAGKRFSQDWRIRRGLLKYPLALLEGRTPLLGPIFVREWLTVPRSAQHYVIRAGYFGVLWILGLATWQAIVGWDRTATLGDTARFGIILFNLLTYYVQLPLIIFFSALAAATTITREKDRRTFVLLLITDLRSYEIVLGKLLGSLLQIAVLLAGMVPILAVLLLLGGVTPGQVAEAFLILAASALAAGSVGGLVALWRDKTFQTLALSFLFLVLYLCVVLGLTGLPALAPGWFAHEETPGLLNISRVQEWLSPFHAMQAVLEPPVQAGTAIPPALGFAGVMLLFTAALNLWAIVRLRVWNPSGEPVMQREAPADAEAEEKDRLKAHAAPGPVREVSENPILWRETRTRAYGRRPLLVKIAYFLVLALICYYALAPLVAGGPRPSFFAAYGLVPVTVISLLLISAQAVTSITSERDGGALDLLLVTDLSPKEFIFGKLWGICYNTKEYLLPPLVLAVVYAFSPPGLLATPPRGHAEMALAKNVESLLAILVGAVIVMAFAIVFGVHVALRTQRSQTAVLMSLGTIFFLSVGTLICIYLLRINTRFEYQWVTFIFFLPPAIYGLGVALNGERPSGALWVAAWLCPPAVFYSVLSVLIARPGSEESADPLIPLAVVGFSFGFTVAAMLIPLLSEFDVALGRTTGGQEE
jgi:ABC-type transport system involved in multi-copper enzyme maturation permease subunit